MDRILRATAANGFVKMSLITARETVQRAKDIHGCTPTTAAALGRALCGASILGNLMKEENASLTLRINGGGRIGSIICVSDSNGCVRGYVTDPTVDLPIRADGKIDVGGAVGRDGFLTVSRDIGLREPYIGSVELVSGEVAEDLTAYMLESEQIPSACALGVLIDTDLSVKAAGGFLVELMPGAPEEYIDKLEDNIFMMDQLTTILSEDGEEEVFAQVLKGMEYHLVGENEVTYKCYCSRERVSEALLSVGSAELEDMINSGETAHLSCQFCDTVYDFTPEDIDKLLNESKNREEI